MRKERRRSLESRLDRQLARAADGSRPAPVRRKAARCAASLAEQLGMLSRPARCEWCRRRLELERHHPSHDEPLAVIFLCRGCHDVADGMAGGAEYSAA